MEKPICPKGFAKMPPMPKRAIHPCSGCQSTFYILTDKETTNTCKDCNGIMSELRCTNTVTEGELEANHKLGLKLLRAQKRMPAKDYQ